MCCSSHSHIPAHPPDSQLQASVSPFSSCKRHQAHVTRDRRQKQASSLCCPDFTMLLCRVTLPPPSPGGAEECSLITGEAMRHSSTCITLSGKWQNLPLQGSVDFDVDLRRKTPGGCQANGRDLSLKIKKQTNKTKPYFSTGLCWMQLFDDCLIRSSGTF